MLCTFSLTFDVPTSLNGGRGWLSERKGKQNFNCKTGRLISNVGSATSHRELYSIKYICGAMYTYK